MRGWTPSPWGRCPFWKQERWARLVADSATGPRAGRATSEQSSPQPQSKTDRSREKLCPLRRASLGPSNISQQHPHSLSQHQSDQARKLQRPLKSWRGNEVKPANWQGWPFWLAVLAQPPKQKRAQLKSIGSQLFFTFLVVVFQRSSCQSLNFGSTLKVARWHKLQPSSHGEKKMDLRQGKTASPHSRHKVITRIQCPNTQTTQEPL